MDIIQALEKLNITKNEAEIYLHLLKTGRFSGAETYKQLNMDKSSFYRSIKNLAKIKLVRIEGERRNQKFYPASVSKLKEIQKEKIEEIKSIENNLDNLMKELEDYSSRSFMKNNIQIFEGENAYFEFMEQKLKGNVKLIRDITISKKSLYSFAGSKKKYDEYVSSFIKKRVEKGIKINMLLDKTIKSGKWMRSFPKDLKEVRQFKGKLNVDCFLNVFGDKIGFMTEKAGKFWGIIIKDKLISDLLAKMFDGLWEQSIKL